MKLLGRGRVSNNRDKHNLKTKGSFNQSYPHSQPYQCWIWSRPRTSTRTSPRRWCTFLGCTHHPCCIHPRLRRTESGERKADKLAESAAQDLTDWLTAIICTDPPSSASPPGARLLLVSEKECVIKRSSEHKACWPFGALNGILANRKQSRREIYLSFSGWEHFPQTR